MKKIRAYKFTIASACLIIVALLLPSSSFSTVPSFTGVDKLAHLGLFFAFSLSYILEYQKEKDKTPPFLASILVIILFILASELLQLFTTSRRFEWIDMLFDLAGSLAAFLASSLIKPRN
ncbi:MAG: VanZ family protein [Spirochaetia bacterium]|jgi:VanZ family protein|nr:VanZ family protein [Spirochaetales bacterium]MDX9784195.1 VanZ family protein [Spirochaetia bacterium]